ncbi:MAG: hypothetical protein KAH08_04225, partial [Methylococcales bacterium]|nr:hypothetical protein [Methylococcales bacterium]
SAESMEGAIKFSDILFSSFIKPTIITFPFTDDKKYARLKNSTNLLKLDVEILWYKALKNWLFLKIKLKGTERVSQVIIISLYTCHALRHRQTRQSLIK